MDNKIVFCNQSLTIDGLQVKVRNSPECNADVRVGEEYFSLVTDTSKIRFLLKKRVDVLLGSEVAVNSDGNEMPFNLVGEFATAAKLVSKHSI